MATARRDLLFIAALGVLTASAPMSIDLYLPALPDIGAALGAERSQVQQTMSVFFLGLALGQLVHGPLSDRHGRRPVLFAGLALYLVAGIGCAMATEIADLITGRFFQGLGAAAGPVVARAAVRDVYRGDRAARAMSFVILVMAMAPLFAPWIGGQLMAMAGWRGIFAAMAAFAVICLLVNLLILRETNGPERRSQQGLATLYIGYFRLLRDDRAVAYLVCGGLSFAALFGYITGASYVYIDRYGIDPQTFGIYFAVNVLGLVMGNLTNGQLVMRFGYRRMLAFGVLIMWVGSLALFASALSDPASLWMVAAPLFVAVGTIGIVGANTVAGLLELAPDSAGAASALFGLFQFGLGASAGALIGAMSIGPVIDMAVVMLVASTGALLANRYLARRTAGE